MGLLKDEMPKEMEIIRSFLQEKDEYRNRLFYKKANLDFLVATDFLWVIDFFKVIDIL